MKRSGKLAGLLTACLAIVGIATTASASASSYESELGTTTFLQGKQATTIVFTTPGGTIKCKSAEFLGQQSGSTATELELEPIFSECTAFGQAATSSTGGCKLRLTVLTATTDTGRIICPAGAVWKFDVPSGNCSLTVGTQTPTGDQVDTTNQGFGATQDVLHTFTLTGVGFTKDGAPGTICPASNTNMTVTGTSTVKGFSQVTHITQVGFRKSP